MTTEEKVEIKRGLRDVYIDRTTSSFIDGKIGKLLYRGYNIDDLAQYSTFEETIYLVIYGTLPTQSQLDDFAQEAGDRDAEVNFARHEKGDGQHHAGEQEKVDLSPHAQRHVYHFIDDQVRFFFLVRVNVEFDRPINGEDGAHADEPLRK